MIGRIESMERINLQIEKYTTNALTELLQKVARDYDLNVTELVERYINRADNTEARCIARNRTSHKRCTNAALPNGNYCKRHKHLALPINSKNIPERTTALKHNHPPYVKDSPDCPKCLHDKQNSTVVS